MPKNILVDLNIILDVLLERKGFQASQTILELQESDSHNVYISGHIVPTFAYLLEQAKIPQAEILRQVSWLLETFLVVPTTDSLLKKATKSSITDYEDAVIEQAAAICKAEAIITRNVRDFKNSVIASFTPEKFAL